MTDKALSGSLSGSEADVLRRSALRSDLTDESLADARRLLGYDFRGARTTIEVSADNTRDYASYIGSTNPLYRDPTRGHRSRWGRPLAPPTMVGTAIIAPGLRGVQWIYGGARWRFHGLYGPGDVLSQSGRLVSAEEKSGRAASSMIMQKGVTQCRDAAGRLIVETEVYTMRIPRRGAGKGSLNYAPRAVSWTQGELDGFAETLVSQEGLVRGREIRYWDDTSVGEEIPLVLCGPLRLSDIALTRGTIVYGIVGGGREDNGGYGYMLDHYRAHPADSFVNPETGVTEHPHRGHWEQYMADEVGMPGIYDIGYQRLGWLTRVVTDWMGDDARLLSLEGWLRRPNIVGDVTWIGGRVVSKSGRGEEAIIECELFGRNQHDEVTVTGKASIALLTRSVSKGGLGS
ncbi:MaoC family dehydratase N-terminal domain-containing protein [Diaminobutyricimonas sp. LJ205]|uniref:FAS1-like dehydratase domain-containing protein n=1 Tax=Diaminobutyricimonas sp. LJ205 TaxID=2683590 RepID=UPI0012F516CA|nr:MaoC family dehydratase N-terminal domain-containing protein [Diaminobutyricimonas sp. LJ205]